MATSLYDLSVACFLQTIGAVDGFLKKGAEHLGANANEVVETRLFADMLPFRFQVVSAAHHSLGAIKGVQAGLAGPPGPSTADYAGLQKLIADTKAGLEALKPGDVNALEGKDVVFQIGDRKLPFKAEGFLLSFSLPNFHFHSTTAYDILRMKGVPLGKRDYLGRMRMAS
jgi:hypothetical protein